MSSDLWPPNNPCSPATNRGLSMVSGSKLQVAKLAQMCPAAPSALCNEIGNFVHLDKPFEAIFYE